MHYDMENMFQVMQQQTMLMVSGGGKQPAFHTAESSITDEVEAELRPPSNNSSHTPILPTKKSRAPRDDSLPSPRGGVPASAIMSSRSTVVQLRRGAAGGGKAGKQAPT